MSITIFQPVAVLMVLTMVVWCYMYFVRNSYVIKNKIHPQKLASPEQVNALLPAHSNNPSNNLKNLFELPVIFYVLCLAIYQLKAVDAWFIGLAWSFVVLRIVHSIIHCTYNRVMQRFVVYFLSGLVLWAMVIKFCVAVF